MRKIFLLAVIVLTPFITCCANSATDTTSNAVKEQNREVASEQINRDNLLMGEVPAQRVVISPVPKEATFAGEVVPLENFDVRESLQRELTVMTYQHGTMSYIMQLCGRYQGLIQNILKEEGIHPDFFYLCVAESMLQPLVSSASAKGYWQFLSGTAKDYGLEVSSQVDERYHWEKATRAACKYFKKAYVKYGNWSLAAASYNIGMGNIDSRIKYQSLKNYYDMQLPTETARYVYRAIAYKLLINNPEQYGFYLKESDKYKPLQYKEVEVSGPIANWSDFAAKHNTNFKLIKMYNEWIRSNSLLNKQGKTYKVWVPVEESRTQL